MICPNCGKNVSADQELCPDCGKPTQFSARMQYFPKPVPGVGVEIPAPQVPVRVKEEDHSKEEKRIAAQSRTIRSQRKTIVLISLAAVIFFVAACLLGTLLAVNSCAGKKEQTIAPAPTNTPSPAPTEAPTPEPTDMPEPEATDTPEPEPTKEPTPEPTPEATDTPEPVPTDTPEPEQGYELSVQAEVDKTGGDDGFVTILLKGGDPNAKRRLQQIRFSVTYDGSVLTWTEQKRGNWTITDSEEADGQGRKTLTCEFKAPGSAAIDLQTTEEILTLLFSVSGDEGEKALNDVRIVGGEENRDQVSAWIQTAFIPEETTVTIASR